MATKRTIILQPISVKNVPEFKAVRLAALGESPMAFGSTYADESKHRDAQWISRAAECCREMNIGYLALDGVNACGLVRGTPDQQDPSTAWVESMWVAPSHRRRGIGQMLVDGVAAWARGRGIRTLKLMVTSENEPAIRFYESLGFAATGRTEPHPREAAFLECEMLLALG